MLNTRHKYLPFLMWLVPLSFFAYQFILRLWPGLMMHQIMQQFSIDASEFGTMAAFYYYGYAGMQIPVAIFLERFGARHTIFVFAVLCGVATVIFTFTNNFYLGLFSRFLVGAGSAIGFLGVSKVVSECFSKDQYPKMIGVSFTFGLMGAIYGGRPVSSLIETYSPQKVALMLSAVSIIIGCAAYFILRLQQPTVASAEERELGKKWDFSAIFSCPTIWFIAIANLLMVGVLEGFADVWGVPYLMTAYNLQKGEAASLISCIFYGMLFGGPFLTMLSKNIGNYLVLVLCGFGIAVAFIVLLFQGSYSHLVVSCLLYVIGVMCCYQVVIFVIGAKLVPAKDLGVTIAFLNCINMLGGSFFHIMIGNVMDLFWTGRINSEGIKIYDLEIYQYSLAIIPGCAIIGAIIICFIGLKTKHKYKQAELKV